MLNDRIENLINGRVGKNNLIRHIHQTIEGLQNSKMKECPKCKEIRNVEDFKDSLLITEYGRFCKFCKEDVSTRKFERKVNTVSRISTNKICPSCGSKMILRIGRYSKFYGCSKFPYCRGTRRY